MWSLFIIEHQYLSGTIYGKAFRLYKRTPNTHVLGFRIDLARAQNMSTILSSIINTVVMGVYDMIIYREMRSTLQFLMPFASQLQFKNPEMTIFLICYC